MRQYIPKTNSDHLLTIFVILFVILLFTSVQIFAQDNNEQVNKNKESKAKVPNETQASGDEINFKNNSGNSIITVTDEGNDKGSITLPEMTSAPSSTIDKLYNENGTLKFKGLPIGSGGGASEINDLNDAKYENLSLYLGSGSGNNNSNAYGNTGIGYNVLLKNTDDQNTAIGRNAGYENTTGGQNVLVGPETNRYNQTGSNNTIIGFHAGFGASTLHSKSGNVFIGFQAGYNELGSNKLYIENSNSTSPLIWGDFASNEVKINGDFHVTGNISQNGLDIIPDWTDGIDAGALVLQNPSLRVGIGTTGATLQPKLHVKGDEGVLFQGTYGNGSVLNLGAGARFHFYPKKAALRSGRVDGTQWDDANIGTNSIAFGSNTIASGDAATSSGFESEATGNSSIALGFRNISTGNRSMAIGSETNANTFASFTIGRFNSGVGSASSWVDTDPLFEVGNGSSASNLQNAMTILKNGRTNIRAETGVDPLKVQVGNSGKLSVFSNGGTSIGTDATAPSNGLLVSGEIRNTGGLLHASDLRFKTNIEEIPNALEHIKKLRGVYYDWKRDEFPERNFNDNKQIGVIAQEVEKEFPELVNTDEQGFKSVDYTKLTPILIEAVKEQNLEFRNENAKLHKRIKELEIRLNNMESFISGKKFANISNN